MSKLIQPQQASVAGFPALFIDLPAEQFPVGAQLALTRPGGLVPDVTAEVPQGGMVALIPAEVAVHLRQQLRRQQAMQAGPSRN